MFILGSQFWTTTGAGAAPPPPPPPDLGVKPSGGFPGQYGDRGPTPEQRRRARVLHGIEAEVVSAVAVRQAATLQTDAAKQQQELRGELALRRIELRSEHLQALAEHRQALIDAEIGQRLRIIQDNEDAILIMLIAGTL